LNGNRLNGFLRRTGALAISGFRSDIPWMDSTAFDLLLLAEFQHVALTIAGVRAAERKLKRIAHTLSKELRFTLKIRCADWG